MKMQNAFYLRILGQLEIEIDSFFEEIDFYQLITRELFETICCDLCAETLRLVENALNDAKLDKTQIQEVVLVGGSTRIPKIQVIIRCYPMYSFCLTLTDSWNF